MVVGICLLIVGSGCKSFDKEVYSRSFEQIKESADKHMESGKHAQVVVLSQALLDAEPGHEQASKLHSQALAANPKLSILTKQGILGSNLNRRIPREGFPLLGRIVLWPLNVALDLVDLITVEVGPCLGVGVDVNLTDAFSVGAQVSAGEVMIGLNRRNLSVRATVDDFLEVLPIESRAFAEARAYTAGAYAVTYANVGVKAPSNQIYQRARDYWGLGVSAEAGLLAVKAGLHPVELWDLLGGIFLMDPLNDNLGASTSVELNSLEKDALKRLAIQVRRRD